MSTALIAARMGSSRFPGKTLHPLHGKPMLERLIERVARARAVSEVVLATTTLPEDDALEQAARGWGVRVTRGSADDVLGRLAAAAAETRAETVVEVLGDNPLVHADLIDDVHAAHTAGGYEYSASVTTEYPHANPSLQRFPIGVRVQIFNREALARCASEAVEPRHREHATSYIAEHPDRFRVHYFPAAGRWDVLHRPTLTFAVNYPRNLDLIERLFERCYPADPNFGLPAAVRAFDADPSLAALMG